MDEQEQHRYKGFSAGAHAPERLNEAHAASRTEVPLRPLSTGEVLDRTFLLYRRNFWLFVAIAMLPAAAVTATSAARMVYATATHRVTTTAAGMTPDAIAQSLNTLLATQWLLLPALVLFVIVYGLSQAASVHAVGQLTRGNRIAAADAYRAVRARWLRWTGVTLRWGWSLVWPMLPVIFALALAAAFARANAVLAGILTILLFTLLPAALVFGLFNFLRNALALPASVTEGLGVRSAMRRSKVLVAGRKGRVFLLLLLLYALQTVAGTLQLPLLLFALATRGATHIVLQAAELLVSFATTALVAPIASIALTLLYVDERVRREGYDIEMLMQQTFRPDEVALAEAEDTGA